MEPINIIMVKGGAMLKAWMRYSRGQDLNPLIYYNIDKGLDAVNLLLKVYVQ
jgi:hypothetical protein